MTIDDYRKEVYMENAGLTSDDIASIIVTILCVLIIGFSLYGCIGTEGKIDKIRAAAPSKIEQDGWVILREEGYRRGSFGKHGGYVWYHVCDADNPDIRYRVNVSMWKGRLEYHYGRPETLQRVNVNYNSNKSL